MDLLLASVRVRVCTVVCEVNALAQSAEVREANIETFLAFVDDLGVGATPTRAVEEKLDELRGCLVSVLVKVCLELVREVALDRLVFEFQD